MTTETTYIDAAMLNLEVCALSAHGRGDKIVVAKCRRALDLLHDENPTYPPMFPDIWNPADRTGYRPDQDPAHTMPERYEQRVQELEAEGMTRSDAQAAADAEALQEARA